MLDFFKNAIAVHLIQDKKELLDKKKMKESVSYLFSALTEDFYLYLHNHEALNVHLKNCLYLKIKIKEKIINKIKIMFTRLV